MGELVNADPFKSCPYGRTHQGTCHQREGTQRPYSIGAGHLGLAGGVGGVKGAHGTNRGEKVSCQKEEYVGHPYNQPQPAGLSCKWVTGPGGFPFNRCDNYASYQDVAVNGEILNDMGFPKPDVNLDPLFNEGEEMEISTKLPSTPKPAAGAATLAAVQGAGAGGAGSNMGQLILALVLVSLLVGGAIYWYNNN